MADIEAWHGAVPVARSAQQARAARTAVLVGGPLGACALAATALFAGVPAEPIALGVLALLAVGGAFLVCGLLTGLLVVHARGAETDLIHTVADGLDAALLVADRKGAVLYRNRALQRVTGTRSGRHASLEELFGGDPPCAQALFRLSRAAERLESRDEDLHVLSGPLAQAGERWLNVAVRPLGAAAGGEDGRLVLWQITDITRERSREIETMGALNAALAFYNGLPQGLFAVGADGRIAHVNATLCKWLGLRQEAGRLLTLADIVSADGAALIQAAGRSRTAARFDLDLVCEDGRTFPAHLICRRLDASGTVSVLVLDRNAEPLAEAGASNERRFARLFQSAPFGIAATDAHGRITSANPAFMRMFLVEGGSMPGSLSELAPESDEATREALEAALARALSGRNGAAPIEIALGGKGELVRRVHVSPMSGKAREGALLYAIDATEQKALEVKFAQSHKMEAVGQLAGGVAHDFNNVLTAIIGFSDLLLQKQRPTDPAYNDIMNIKNSANRAAGLVRQLLAFSRRQTLQPEVLELGEVLTDLAPFLNRSLGETIALKILPGRDLWYVKADKTQLTQVVLNLAVNAKDAMPNGGSLAIRMRNIAERESMKLAHQGMAAGEYVLIEVEDTGVGIPADVMGKIFEPFFTTKDVGKGTGLGLSTVYGIVKQTGGYVFAESEPGKGTVFRVYLPRHIVSEEELAAQRAEKKKENARDLTGTGRVLLVEDEDIVRSFAVRALSRQGYEVLEAGTGMEALEVMERERGRVDIVVSDVVMPEMDGPTLLKELRKTKPDLKIIFVSGYPDDAFKKSLGENEAYAFLPKPFTLPQLAAKVKEQLGK